jgi:hypothetical protein
VLKAKDLWGMKGKESEEDDASEDSQRNSTPLPGEGLRDTIEQALGYQLLGR